jgi:hypothetical protein
LQCLIAGTMPGARLLPTPSRRRRRHRCRCWTGRCGTSAAAACALVRVQIWSQTQRLPNIVGVRQANTYGVCCRDQSDVQRDSQRSKLQALPRFPWPQLRRTKPWQLRSGTRACSAPAWTEQHLAGAHSGTDLKLTKPPAERSSCGVAGGSHEVCSSQESESDAGLTSQGCTFVWRSSCTPAVAPRRHDTAAYRPNHESVGTVLRLC